MLPKSKSTESCLPETPDDEKEDDEAEACEWAVLRPSQLANSGDGKVSVSYLFEQQLPVYPDRSALVFLAGISKITAHGTHPV